MRPAAAQLRAARIFPTSPARSMLAGQNICFVRQAGPGASLEVPFPFSAHWPQSRYPVRVVPHLAWRLALCRHPDDPAAAFFPDPRQPDPAGGASDRSLLRFSAQQCRRVTRPWAASLPPAAGSICRWLPAAELSCRRALWPGRDIVPTALVGFLPFAVLLLPAGLTGISTVNRPRAVRLRRPPRSF